MGIIRKAPQYDPYNLSSAENVLIKMLNNQHNENWPFHIEYENFLKRQLPKDRIIIEGIVNDMLRDMKGDIKNLAIMYKNQLSEFSRGVFITNLFMVRLDNMNYSEYKNVKKYIWIRLWEFYNNYIEILKDLRDREVISGGVRGCNLILSPKIILIILLVLLIMIIFFQPQNFKTRFISKFH